MSFTSVLVNVVDSIFNPSQWSTATFKPPKDNTPSPKHTSLSELYSDAFNDPQFQQLFILGFAIFYALDVLGCYLYDTYVCAHQKKKLQREQFAGQFISIIHASMIAMASTIFLLFYDVWDAYEASPNNPLVILYKTCSVFSGSYFVLDALLIGIYYKQSFHKTLAFLMHHACVGVCMCGVHFTHPVITYLAALNFMIEWTTFFLTLRVFARIWNNSTLYFLSGWAVLISYPMFRIVFLPCLTYISFKSVIFAYWGNINVPYMVGGTQMFVTLLSAYYYFVIILANPKQIYTLNKAKKTTY